MSKSIYVLAIGIFAMVTSELIVGGLMPQIAEELGVSIPQVGYLITAFALAMAIGGPLITAAVFKLKIKQALLVLFAIFLAGNALAAMTQTYEVMVLARVITGAAAGAFFGVAVSAAVQVTKPDIRGRAISAVLQGLMLGTALGLPLSTLVGEQFGWRAAFIAIGVLTLIAAIATIFTLPRIEKSAQTDDLRTELMVFRRPKLWFVMATSTLIIGATFAAFSYFTPILTDVAGFSRDIVPLLLLAYGAATVVGNIIVGRLAQPRTISVIVWGLVLNVLFLTAFALFANMQAVAVLSTIGIGLVGITLNPAMATRVHRAGNTGTLVNTLHSSFITFGVVVGSWIGGLGIATFDLRAPLWSGVALALLALCAMAPAVIASMKNPASFIETEPVTE